VIAIWFAALGLSQCPSAVPRPQNAPNSLLSSPHEERCSFVGDLACRPCHQDKAGSYLATAHRRASRLPDVSSIAGSFTKGKDVMTTLNPELTFRMEARDGHFYQTAIRQKRGRITKRTEQFDLVIGSATKGQTYLYWVQDALFELPVSYWTELNRWVNSPGYVDGSADFDRPVPPRCVECHATYFQPISSSPSANHYNKANIVLGISCERCHGPGMERVQNHLAKSANSNGKKPMPPLRLSRDRQIDVCGQCHGGVGEPIARHFPSGLPRRCQNTSSCRN